MAFGKRKREPVRLDLTPMVDVVFLLLIFFMISTTFVETSGLSINLPQSSSVQSQQEPEEFKVYLSKQGGIEVEGSELSLEQYRSRLQALGADVGKMVYMLHADKDALHGRVVEVMDMARSAGFTRMAIITQERGAK